MSTTKSTSVPASGNGHSNGKSANHTGGEKPTEGRQVTAQRSKSGVSIFGNYVKLRKASRRPLPSDLGDGNYRQVTKRPGLGQDIRSLSRAGQNYITTHPQAHCY